MRKIIIGLLLTATLALAGCENLKSVLEGGSSLTAAINNPVGRNDLATIENAYGIILSGVVAYRRLPLCPANVAATFANPCSKRSIVLQLQALDRKAHAAILAARNFVRNNPTLSAVTLLAAAQAALEDFRTVATTNGVL